MWREEDEDLCKWKIARVLCSCLTNGATVHSQKEGSRLLSIQVQMYLSKMPKLAFSPAHLTKGTKNGPLKPGENTKIHKLNWPLFLIS